MRLSGRDFEHTRTHVELCCGRYLSSLIYHLQADRAARALAIDIEEWAVIRDRIPVALRPRILYVQRDVEHLTYDELDKLCHQAFGAHVGLSQVSTVHWSPPCETMSVSLSKRGRQKHRHPDGRAKSATAVKHDSCFENVIGILERLVAANSAVLVSIENPRSPGFLSKSSLQRLARQPGWRLVDRTDYCKNADCCADDGDHDWPRKPTSLLLYGVEPSLELPVCDYDCAYRLVQDPRRHRAVLRGRSSHPEGQHVIRDPALRSRMPHGLFHRLWCSHWRLLRAQDRLPDEIATLSCCPVCAVFATQHDTRQRLAQLWHARLGHPAAKRTRATHGHVLDGPLRSSSFSCRACLAGKICRRPHQGHLPRASYPLGLVHADLQGPFDVESNDGYNYSLLLTDDYTGRHFAYLLSSKDRAGQALQIFIQQVGRPAQVRADNGGEFISEQDGGFLTVCRENAIRVSFSLPHSYQQNGVAERAHRTIIETTRTLLISARLPVTFWSWAYRHAVYLTGYLVGSRRPLSPLELWFGATPSVSHLRCFGSRVTYKPPDGPGKLAPVGHRSIFLGFVQGAHDDKPQGIILCDQESLDPKIVYTNDFSYDHFDESFLWDEPVGVRNDDYCVLRDEEWEGPEPPFFVACDDEVRTPPPAGKSSLWSAYQEFAGLRRPLLRKEGLCARDLEARLSREWHEHERSKAVRSLEEQRRAPCTHPLAADESAMEEPLFETAGQSATAAAPGSSAKAVAPALGALCRTCNDHRYSTSGAYEMILCDACDYGNHRGCIDNVGKYAPGKADRWLCTACRQPGVRIELWDRPSRRYLPAVIERCYKNGLIVDVIYDDGNMEQVTLDHIRWRAESPGAEAVVKQLCNVMLDVPTPRNYQHALALDSTAPVNERGETPWMESMRKEWESIQGASVGIPVPAANSIGKNLLACKWVYRVKWDGRLKSRLVALGCHQDTLGLNMETASATPKMSTIRLLLALAVQHDLDIDLCDVECAFLNSGLVDSNGDPVEIFMEYPKGFERPGYVLQLQKSIYGLKSASCDWGHLLQSQLTLQGFSRSSFDACLFSKTHPDGRTQYVLPWVDDILMIGAPDLLAQTKAELSRFFTITGGGPAKQYLGMILTRDRAAGTLTLTNPSLCEKIARTADVLQERRQQSPMSFTRLSKRTHNITPAAHAAAKGRYPYQQVVGMLQYLCTTCRPDLSFATKELARYNSCFNHDAWLQARRVATYAMQSAQVGLTFRRDSTRSFSVEAFVDADYNGTPEERLSTTGFFCTVAGMPISWASRTQKCCARSVAEAEFVSLSTCTAEVLYLRQFLCELGLNGSTASIVPIRGASHAHSVLTDVGRSAAVQGIVHSDSTAAIANAKLPVGWLNDKLKHIQNSYFFFRQYYQAGWVNFHHIPGLRNPADALTKGFDSLDEFKLKRRLLCLE